MQKKYKNVIFFFALTFLLLSVTHFVYALEATYPSIGGTTLGSNTTLPEFVKYFFELAIVSAGILGVLSISISGIRMLFSAGNPSALGEARERILGSILGIVLLLFSFVILQTINPQLTTITTTVLSSTTPPGLYGVLTMVPVGYITNPFGITIAKADDGEIELIPADESDSSVSDISSLIYICNPGGQALKVDIYSDTDFNDNGTASSKIIACGQVNSDASNEEELSVSLISGGSYKTTPLEPGVYLFKNPGCFDGEDNLGTDVITDTQLIPTDFQDVSSAFIINGTGANDPNYSFVLNKDPDLKGQCSIPYTNFTHGGSACVPISGNLGCQPVDPEPGSTCTQDGECMEGNNGGADCDNANDCIPTCNAEDQTCELGGDGDVECSFDDPSVCEYSCNAENQTCEQGDDGDGDISCDPGDASSCETTCDSESQTCIVGEDGDNCTDDTDCAYTCNEASETCELGSDGDGIYDCNPDNPDFCANMSQCPDGEVWDSQYQVCCPSDQPWDQNSQTCGGGGDDTCDGTVMTDGVCCPLPFVSDDEEHCCPSGQTWNTQDDKCGLPTTTQCPSGESLVNGQCVPDNICDGIILTDGTCCPTGFNGDDGDHCCPADQSWNTTSGSCKLPDPIQNCQGGTKQPDGTCNCDAGSVLQGANCVACPNFVNGGQCVNQCPANKKVSGKDCVDQCPPGTIIPPTSTTNVCQNQCVGGTMVVDNVHEPFCECQGGQTAVDGVCTCPVGKPFFIDQRCYANKLIVTMTFSPSTVGIDDEAESAHVVFCDYQNQADNLAHGTGESINGTCTSATTTPGPNGGKIYIVGMEQYDMVRPLAESSAMRRGHDVTNDCGDPHYYRFVRMNGIGQIYSCNIDDNFVNCDGGCPSEYPEVCGSRWRVGDHCSECYYENCDGAYSYNSPATNSLASLLSNQPAKIIPTATPSIALASLIGSTPYKAPKVTAKKVVPAKPLASAIGLKHYKAPKTLKKPVVKKILSKPLSSIMGLKPYKKPTTKVKTPVKPVTVTSKTTIKPSISLASLIFNSSPKATIKLASHPCDPLSGFCPCYSTGHGSDDYGCDPSAGDCICGQTIDDTARTALMNNCQNSCSSHGGMRAFSDTNFLCFCMNTSTNATVNGRDTTGTFSNGGPVLYKVDAGECGNGYCNTGESPQTCPGDCGTISTSSTNNANSGQGMTQQQCQTTCSASGVQSYSNGVCICLNSGGTDNNPDPSNGIPTGGNVEGYCGNGSCNSGETPQSCPADCAAYSHNSSDDSYCGDGQCDGDENADDCQIDCSGDGGNDGGGSCETADDCGDNELCTDGECEPGVQNEVCLPFTGALSIYIIKGENGDNSGSGASFYRDKDYVNLSAEDIGYEFEYAGADALLDDEGQTQNQSAGEDTLFDPRGNFLLISYFKNEKGGNQKCSFNTSQTNISRLFNTDYSQNGIAIFPTK